MSVRKLYAFLSVSVSVRVVHVDVSCTDPPRVVHQSISDYMPQAHRGITEIPRDEVPGLIIT